MTLRLVLALLVAAPLAGRAQPQMIDAIAALVDGQVVLVSEVLDASRPVVDSLQAQGAPEREIARVRAAALERLIEERLMARIVERNEMSVEEEEVNATIAEIAGQNGLSVEQLYASVVYHGLSVEKYREQIRGDLERRNLVQAAVGQRVEVSEQEVRQRYRERYDDQPQGGETVRVRQILRAVGGPNERPVATACAQASAARDRVLAGEDFARVAAEVSEVAPRDGGDIGWLPLASVAPWMEQALEGLEPGDLSEVLELPFGCSVLQLVERREVQPVSFESAREPLYREIWDAKLEAEYRLWMDELREQSYIERRGYFGEPGAGPSAFAPPAIGEP